MEISLLYTVATLLIYILAGRLVMRSLRGGTRDVVMALLNLAAVLNFLFHDFPSKFLLSLGLVVFFYGMFRVFFNASGRLFWLAFFSPIAALIVIRYVPGQVYVALGHALGKNLHSNPVVLGLSYMTFRCSRLVKNDN